MTNTSKKWSCDKPTSKEMTFFFDTKFISILGVITEQLQRSTNDEFQMKVVYGSVKLRIKKS